MPNIRNQNQSIFQRTPKAVYGAVIGAVVGVAALRISFAVAVYLLIVLGIIAAYVFVLGRQQAVSGAWSPRKLSPAPVLGAMMVGVMSIAGLNYLGVSLAWHPQGTIKKTVQNVTTKGPVSDADTSATAVIVHPGDIVNYSVTISNTAAAASNQYNDLAFTVLTDTLPDGVQLVSDPTKRIVTENIGTIKPGNSVTKTYQVKVVSSTNNLIAENKACFSADSVVKDNPQKGCDLGIVKVTVPVTPPTPTPPTPTPPTPTPPTPTPPTPTPPTPTPPTPTPPTPTPPTPTPPTPTPPTPTPTPTPTAATTTDELPNVGGRDMIVVVLFAVIIGYLFSAFYGYANGNKAKRFN